MHLLNVRKLSRDDDRYGLTGARTGSSIVKRNLDNETTSIKAEVLVIINDEALRDELHGFDALLQSSDERLGTVAEVVASLEDMGQHLLRVTRSVASPPIGTHTDAHDADVWARLLSNGQQEQHLIPLVPDIIPRIDRATRTLWVDPPKGLLSLGCVVVNLSHTC